MCNMNTIEMTNFAKDFLKKNYQMNLEIPISMNGRLKRVLGRFRFQNKKPLRIEMSRNFVEYSTKDEVIDVLKHELIHYALYAKGLPYKDGEAYFEGELKKHNSSPTRTFKPRGQMVIYQCQTCGNEYPRSRRLSHDGKGHYCASRKTGTMCKGKLKNIGKREVNVG